MSIRSDSFNSRVTALYHAQIAAEERNNRAEYARQVRNTPPYPSITFSPSPTPCWHWRDIEVNGRYVIKRATDGRERVIGRIETGTGDVYHHHERIGNINGYVAIW